MIGLAKKKILYVITKSNWGGAQRYVFDLATSLPKDQLEVAVALGGEGLLKEKLTEAGIRVITLSHLQRDYSVTADIGGFGAIYRSIKEFQPDVVHLNSSKAGVLGSLAARLSGVRKIVFTVHGWPFEEKRNWLWRLVALLGSYQTALFSHTVIVISKKDLRIGRRMPFCARKMRLVYNGIQLPVLSDGQLIRSAFPAGVRITGTVGELTGNKNQISLIEKAHATPDMYVAIVGEGEERKNLEAKIRTYHLEDRVKLFGFQPVEKVLHGFDVFALPSKKEGLPYVLLEAKAAGLPIEATRVGGIPDILENASDFTLDQMVRETALLY